MSDNRIIPNDFVVSMLKEEIVYICPVGISKKCQRFEAVGKQFTNHHIDNNPSNFEYWNLIRICEPCHDYHNKHFNDSELNRQIKLRKRNLAIYYFGGQAVDALRMAYVFGSTTSTPSSVLRLLERNYLIILNKNVFTAGSGNHASFQEYSITQEGKRFIENLFGRTENITKIGDFNI